MTDENYGEGMTEAEKTIGKAVLKKLKEKADLYGIEVEWSDIKDENDLNFIATAIKNAVEKMEEEIDAKTDFLAEEKVKAERKVTPQSPSGSVPLRGSDMGFDNIEGYDSYAEMFSDLQKKAMSQNKFEATQAKKQLNALTVKAMRALRDTNKRIEIKIPSDAELERFGVHGEIGLVDILRSWWKRSGQKEKDVEKWTQTKVTKDKGESQ